MNIFKINFPKNRIFGLDLLRAVAILSVVIAHTTIFMPATINQYVSPFGFDGVTMFFVLSGFLIGGILIRSLNKKNLDGKFMLNFWSRRWFRTFPAYFFCLIILYLISIKLFPSTLPDRIFDYFVFLQNFSYPQPEFFSESWSLAVEEWFYLLVPALVFVCIKFLRLSVKSTFLIVSLGIIIYGFGLRLFRDSVMWIDSYREWDLVLRRQVITRLDSIMYGVLGAYTFFYYPKFWDRVRIPGLALGLFITLAIRVMSVMGLNQPGFYFNVVILSLAPFGVLCMLPFLNSWKSWSSKISKFFTYVSLISYSMYLLNLTFIVHVFMEIEFLNNLPVFLKQVFYWVSLFLGSTLMYKYLELPFINMREKFEFSKKK